MPQEYPELGRYPHWLPDNAHAVRQQPNAIAPLINDKASLTLALMALSDGEFAVNLLRQTIALPYHHEQLKLARPLHEAAMIREVELLVRNTPVVYARSIVPLALVRNGNNGLAGLGQTPLGHLLFKDGKIRVSKRQFAFPTYHGKQIVARRTPYEYHNSTILVAEFFLPNIHYFIE